MKFKKLFKELIETEENLYHVKVGLAETENPEELINAIELELFKLSKEVFDASKEEHIYWSYCSTATYKKTYKKRLKKAIRDDKNSIHNEVEFVEKEIEHLNLLKTNFGKSNYNIDLLKPIDKKIKILMLRKQELLPNEREVLLDFSDSSATDKVIYLHRLGVLDFLRKHSSLNNSTNNLAELLSAITGENATTLQSYLNPIYSNQTNQKNNPLSKKNPVEKVEKQLIKMGISI